jgi:chromosomal replication initiator protein
MKISAIKEIVAKYMGVTVPDINSRSRLKNVALARQIAMFYSFKKKNTQIAIGKEFDRIHSNISYAVKRINEWRECDWEVREILDGIENEYPILKSK